MVKIVKTKNKFTLRNKERGMEKVDLVKKSLVEDESWAEVEMSF